MTKRRNIGNSWDDDIGDMRCLYQAANVIQRRSQKPNGLMLKIFVKVLSNTADDISRGKLPVQR